MKIHEATEQAYKNGYEDGYRDGKNRVMEEIAFPKLLVRQHEPSKEELEALMYLPTTIITTSKESITPIYPCCKWIPVTDMFPKDGDRVLAYYQDGMVRVIVNDGGFPMVLSNKLEWVRVTHWMPLPELPECPTASGKRCRCR